jgi:Family of unknown function (DUF6194)
MEQDAIRRYIAETFDGVDVDVASQDSGAPEIAWGDTFFIYDPDRNLEPQLRFPFATIVTKDYGDFDDASDLDRPSVFRLNIGVSKETFAALFPDDSGYDFTELDRLLPHPVYAKNHFVCVLNPSDSTFQTLQPLLSEAYAISVGRVVSRRSAKKAKDTTRRASDAPAGPRK